MLPANHLSLQQCWLYTCRPTCTVMRMQCRWFFFKVNDYTTLVTELIKLTMVGSIPGTMPADGRRLWAAAACICKFFRMRLFRPFCRSCSRRCWGGWRYLQGGSFLWHFPWRKQEIKKFWMICFFEKTIQKTHFSKN